MTTRALILIDVQREYFDGPLAIKYPPVDESLANILRAIDAAEAAGIPIAIVEHRAPDGFPVFAAGSEGQRLHPYVAARATDEWKAAVKSVASVFPETDLADWLADNGVDTITLVGYMANNCVLGTAADAEPRGIAVEVLSDATGAIPLSNSADSASAQQVHETLMALLNSNFAAVATTGDWAAAVAAGEALVGSNLVESAQS
ncbi:isochorismatase [Corynebacterium xerosis]|uniref:Isochorismatase n=1 Tax=Corynebacterium xerosis TaxID=1725 RepID=A0A2N6T0C5_9CORY|nr:isochorismatase family protein [Corynebacterium xerosis]PMC62760.1 isochorismatase [Corynebacterium xerosis]